MPQAGSTFLGLTLATWSTGMLALLLVACAHLGLYWWSRRLRRTATPLQQEGTTRHWLARGAREALTPLALLLWIQAAHFVALTLLGELPASAATRHAMTITGALRGLLTVLGFIWLMVRVARTLASVLQYLASRSPNDWDDVMAPFAGRALRLILPMLALILGAPTLAFSPSLTIVIQNAVSLLLIGTLALLLLQFIDMLAQLLLRHQRMDVADNRQARAAHTQVMMLKRIASVVIGLLTLAAMLMVFESVRRFGTAILASAGVAGIIVGFAAQKSIATLLAGVQIALTQPIRLDDVVIVDGEWGRIEEISLTYVVVAIWDQRRLIVPITHFIEQPFQNWTRTSADLLGSVFFYTDYAVPMTQLRAELQRILEASPLWDRRVAVLQVTDAKEHTVEIRALASAADSSKAWDLRCEVREKMIAFLQQHHPDSLPRLRNEVRWQAASDDEPTPQQPAASPPSEG